ncbi:hypothetical protein EJD97_008779 [Solanum chilense]|uniref:Protein kinase domain-containing protein n=1 Tax=Solanum chilense TaxID=4083 RepID=A0A6N2AJG5_SOLCI|nr:hypothetical protein EJD97_008779 [Solanum chilense]
MTSRQEFTKFENEVKLIAKLQHRNLTKLLGYYINGAEKFLFYEFRSSNSLHKVIFGTKSYITFFLFTIVRVVLILKRKKFGSIPLKLSNYFLYFSRSYRKGYHNMANTLYKTENWLQFFGSAEI